MPRIFSVLIALKKVKGGGVIHEMSSVKFLRFIIALSLNFVSENFLF